MSTLDKTWTEFLARFSRLPVWLPGTSRIAVGDIGVIDKRGWTRLHNLRDFGVDFVTVRPEGLQSQYEVSSEGASLNSLDFSAETGEAMGPTIAAGLNTRAAFAEEGAFVVRAYSVEAMAIGNLGEVENRITSRDANSRFWQRRWVYVTELATAEPFVMLVAGKKGASADIRAQADTGVAQLGQAGVGVSVSNSVDVSQSFAAMGRAPFLWRGRWRGGWFSNAMRDLGDEEDLGIELPGARKQSDDSETFEEFASPALYDVEEQALDNG